MCEHYATIAIEMTIALGWVGTRKDGREGLFLASDSRLRSGGYADACPKIITLPRSDCAICFAGDTHATYPLMLQGAYAIAAHGPGRDRGLDISQIKDHLVLVFNDVISSFRDQAEPLKPSGAQFIFAGYSWLQKKFRIWTISYGPGKRFVVRESLSFHERLRKVAFVGDWSNTCRANLTKSLNKTSGLAYLEPIGVLADLLQGAGPIDTIGGAPQMVHVGQNMTTSPLCVRWNGADTLFGRPLRDYENTDYQIVDPLNKRLMRPRSFGHRVDNQGPNGEPTSGVGLEHKTDKTVSE